MGTRAVLPFATTPSGDWVPDRVRSAHLSGTTAECFGQRVRTIARPDDRLREAIQTAFAEIVSIASSLSLLAMTTMPRSYRTTPDVYPARRRGGLISFFRKQCASLPT